VEFRLVAYDRLGARRGVLPVPLEFTPVHSLNELPTISIHYPRWAVGSSYLDNDPEVAFEYNKDGINWVEPWNSRYRLQKVDLDWLDTTATTRYDFVGIGEILRGVTVFDAYGLPLNDEGKVQFPLTNAGQVLNIIWVNARDQRGMMQGFSNNYSQTNDSNGTPYGHQFSTSYDKKTAMSTILDTLVAQGLVDYWWQGRQMNLVKANAPASFTDHINDGVRFVGSGGNTGVDSAPEQVTHGQLATHIIVNGENNLRWIFPTGVTLPEGRREIVLEYSGVDDQATAQLLAGPHIIRAQNSLKNTTRQFHLKADTTIFPYHDYKVGDWVPVQRAGTMERMRIQSISITVNEHGAQGYVTLGDKTDEMLDKLYKRIQALSGGVKNEGAGTPPTPSSRTPRAATGLVVGNEPYIDFDGNVKSLITASWQHDGKDVNGNTIQVKDHWFFYRIPGEVNWTLLTRTANKSVSWGPLPTYRNGSLATYEFTVETHSQAGAYSAIAAPVTSTMIADSTPPLVPTPPTLSVWMRAVTVSWNGLGVGNLQMPKDLNYVNIWESQSADGSGAIKVGTFDKTSNLNVGIRNAGTTYWYALSAVDFTGNESAKSNWVSVTPASLIQNPDIDAIVDDLNADIGQNTTDIIAAQNAANQALQDAADAGQAALDAATVAAGKAAIYTQSARPPADTTGLWIDTGHKNIPRSYLGKGKALIVNGPGSSTQPLLTANGWTVTARTTDPTFEEAMAFDLVVYDYGYSLISAASKTLLAQLFEAGMSIYTTGNDTTSMPPLFTGTASRGATKNPIRSSGPWSWAEFGENDLNLGLTGVNPAATVTGVTLNSTTGLDMPEMVIMEHATNFARWAHLQTYATPSRAVNPHLDWIADNWVAVRDTDILTALATANQAITNAQTAKNAADAAAAAAVAAQQTADGKTTVSAAVPNNTTDLAGKPAGAMWTQVVAGKVVGAWYKAASNSTSWTAMPFDPVMIPQINIGTGTFGDLDGIRMKLRSLGVDKLLVTDQTSYIENGDFETGDMSGWNNVVGWAVSNTTPYSGTYAARVQGPNKLMVNNFPIWLENVAGKETEVRVKIWAKGDAGTKFQVMLVNSALSNVSNTVTLTTSTAYDAEFSTTLKATAAGWAKLAILTEAANGATAWTYIDNVRMYKRMNAEMYVDGSVDATTIKARSVQANHLEADLVLTSEVIAGNPAASHARLNPTGLRVFAPDPVSPSNPPREVVRLGVSTTNDYFGVVKTNGELGASIDENGQGSFERMIINNGGLRYKGQEFETIMNRRPEGIIVWDQWDGTVLPSVANGQERGLFELAFIPNPARMYKICMSPLMYQASANTATDAALRLRYTGDGSQPTTLSTPIAEVYEPILTNGGWRQTFQISGRLLRALNGPYIRLLFTIAGASGAGLAPVANQSVTAWVEDIGPDIPVSGKLSVQTSGGGGGSQPVKVTRTETFASTSSTNYDGAGNVYTNGGNTYMYQGLSPAGYGSLKSLCRFNPGNQWWDGRLAGATINNMRLYFYFRHWYNNSGGTAYVGVHSFPDNLPATFSHSGQIMYQPNWPKPGGFWLDIPSAYWANIANATYKGFSLFGDGTYNTYGYADRPTLEITYTK